MNKLTLSLLLAFAVNTLNVSAQEVINIWHNELMPYAKKSEVAEYSDTCWDQPCLYNTVKPTLTIYKSKKNHSGKAVIILPGGGYELLAIKHEGHDVAKLLARQGITAAVLKYRLPNPKTSTNPELTPLIDVRQSIDYLRDNSEQYHIHKNKIGVLGFSAGAHLATVASLWHTEKPSQQPDFSVLIYGVTRLNAENLKWLEKSLYFRPLNPEEKKKNTLLNHVTQNTPPAFLVHAMDDTVCHYSESTLYAQALTKVGVEAETHLYAKGGHGFGLGSEDNGTAQWLDLAASWIHRL